MYGSELLYEKSLGKKYLKKDAVPSVFTFPEHLIKNASKERNPKKRKMEDPLNHKLCPLSTPDVVTIAMLPKHQLGKL